jgi:peptidoglycan hydrolase-like protein with peptidoglycan-binding domain
LGGDRGVKQARIHVAVRSSMRRPNMRTFCCWLLLFLTGTSLFADEQIRQVQEELRRRNLYYGDIDGRATAEIAAALKRYQTRKGFEPTGQIDEVTAKSLNIQVANAAAPDRPRLPDVPVLKSDAAREISESQRIALERQSEQNLDPSPTPAPPAEEPSAAQNLTPDRVTRFVEQYLRDSEGNDIAGQTGYFAYPVEYFDHGTVGADFVRKDVTNYLKRWPERKYTLSDPVTFFAAPANEGDTLVEFDIVFRVANKEHNATGRTRNYWTVRPQGDDLKIVSIREQRLRDR